ncbi:MAG TPA: hypothetical protein VGO69_08080, partial [Pyrinomonadaceae bacterium]|nr:hypothetical protein [Pyrinomonadaceae bacterium]
MKRVAILLSILIAVAPCSLQAQTSTSTSSGQDASKKRTGGGTQTTTVSGQPTQVSLKIEERDRITLRNRFGPIVVTGIGGDTLEATASVIKQGTSDYKVRLSASRPSQDRIMITTAVLTPGQAQGEKAEGKGVGVGIGQSTGKGAAQQQTPKPAKPIQPAQPAPSQPPVPQAVAQGTGTGRTPRPPRPPRAETPPTNALRGVGDIKLEVKLPSNAHIELIDSRRYATITTGAPIYLTNTRNDVSVTNIDTPVSVISSGEVQAAKIAGIEVKTRAGNVQVRDVAGPVSIATVTGSIVVRDTDGDVRAVSISGPISIECA